jgi:hypothetical protein
VSGGDPAPGGPGTAGEPVRYMGGVQIDRKAHDGKLRPAMGVENIQILRGTRYDPARPGEQGWTFHHQPMLAYWNGKFYMQHWGDAIGEHVPPNATFLSTSPDGRSWSAPEVVFPQWTLPDKSVSLTHQRMGFYVAPNGMLLALAFHGRTPNPFGEHGIGRVVREVRKDGAYGPIYFIRYNRHAGWNETNTGYPFYRASQDAAFVAACDALLADRLMTLQWWQEDQSPDGFYAVRGNLQALSYFHRKDGAVVALWKTGLAALSFDEGKSWTKPMQPPSINTGAAKMWGQRTADGRYALVYNPINDGYHRYPLAIVTGEDGIHFDNLLAIHGELPPRRFFGSHKDLGPQYVRGIAEGNGIPPGGDLWVTYSVNKEDIWISRVPLRVAFRETSPVRESFDRLAPGGSIPGWNTYSPKWASVRVADFPSTANRSLELRDREPYDYAKAVRIFLDAPEVRVSLRLFRASPAVGQLDIELETSTGASPVRLTLDEKGVLHATDGAVDVEAGQIVSDIWRTLELRVSRISRRFDVLLDGAAVVRNAAFAEAAPNLERLVLRTGPRRIAHGRNASPLIGADLPGADTPEPLARFYVDDVSIKPLGRK